MDQSLLDIVIHLLQHHSEYDCVKDLQNITCKKKILSDSVSSVKKVSMTDNNDDEFKSKGFDYDSLVEDGLKDVVKRGLKITSETGLIGNSHFFISFNGDDPDVIVPNELKTTDNSEIKIIIQHQFWDLKSTDNHFEVTLSFNGKKKNISVPFKALTSFTDPSVGFGLQFKTDKQLKLSNGENQTELPDVEKSPNSSENVKSGEIVSLDAFRDKK